MNQKTPAWVTCLVILVALPLFATPELLARCPAQPSIARTLVWGYPFYMAIAAWLAWASWTQRRYITWLLLAIMVLTTVAIWMLVTAPLVL